MKKTILLATALVAATGSAALAEGPLRLGMTPEPFMPATSIDASGKWIGTEADLSNAICAQIPEGCDIRQMAWDALIPALTEGKVDFIVGAFSVTDARRQVVDFSVPYQMPHSFVAGAKADTTPVKSAPAADGSGDVLSPEGLDGKIFGVQNSSVQANYLAQYLPDAEVKSYDTADTAVADLMAGRLDYVVMGDSYIEDFVAGPTGADYELKLQLPENVVLGQGVAYAVRKGDAETLAKINAPLEKLIADGTVKEIQDKWTN